MEEAARHAASGVTVLGPVPRPSRDPAATWEAMAAFQLDRSLCALVRDELADQPVTYVALGKTLCTRRARPRSGGHGGGARRNRPSDYLVDPSLYVRDMVHLNPAGYRADSLRVSSSERRSEPWVPVSV